MGIFPYLLERVAGNSSDKKLFRERLRAALKEQIQHSREKYIVNETLDQKYCIQGELP